MPRKRNPTEADDLFWYRLECFKRSPYFKRLQVRLQEDEDGSRLGRIALFREIVRLAPLVPIESDGLRWVTVKLDLNAPIPVVLSSLECLLKEMQDEEKVLEWWRFVRRNGGMIRMILDQEPRSPLERLASVIWEVRSKKRRVHLKNLMLRLEVWDRVQAGADIKDIAKERRVPTRTVGDLYKQANLDICGSPPPRRRRERLIQDLDRDTHFRTCRQCANAKRSEDLCVQGKAYIDRDYVSLHELPLDLSGEAASFDGDDSEMSAFESGIRSLAGRRPASPGSL